MIFLCLLPVPIPFFQYLNSTHRTNYMSILVGELGHDSSIGVSETNRFLGWENLSQPSHIEAQIDQGCEQFAREAPARWQIRDGHPWHYLPLQRAEAFG